MQNQLFNQLPAGIFPEDKSANIFECNKTKKVFFIQEGNVKDFSLLSNKLKRILLKELLANKQAMQDLGHLGYTKAL